ncbi:MAG TPA: hypothetical protein VM597_05585 [Gemmataceae bacterium]|nr:hypothetical protein [Gemmataceae bacterium]
MTEAEWRSDDDPDRMSLAIVRGSPRKLRLFAVACARHLPADVLDPHCTHCLDLAEASADGRATAGDRQRAAAPVIELANRTEESARSADERDNRADPTFRAHHAAVACAATAAADRFMIRQTASLVRKAAGDADAERQYQCAVLRDVYDNPARPSAFDPAWRTADATGLARAVYDDRAYDRLPLLADALTDAGCDNEDILAHCRSAGPHVRGCWVVDLVLGLE